MNADTLARMTSGYLQAAQWADAPENGHARFTAAATRDAGAVCAAFLAYVGPALTAQALALIAPDEFGRDLWLTRCGHGVGFWDRDALDVPPVALPDLADRDARPVALVGRDAETLGQVLSAAAYGTAGSISPFAYPTLSAYRGWLAFDCDSAALALSGRVAAWPFWQRWTAAPVSA